MRAAIFDPYLDTLGGGERYVMTFASTLAKNGWNVDVEWKEDGIREKLEERLGLHLKGVNIVSTINKGKGYDLCFWLSDGSIPNLSAKKNILHFQVPFHGVSGKSLINKIKLRKINKIICNSKFTKSFIDDEYDVDSNVVYPPVGVENFKPGKKENVILSVGRFSQLLQAKRQDVLVDAFKKMVDSGLTGWKLVLVGGSDIGGKEFVSKLKKDSKGYPIEILENLDFNQLKQLYGKAKIFWSASGYGVNEEKEPEKVEHFGITVVEAMAAGCVTIVVSKGGQKEIIKDPIDGILWDNVNQLLSATKMLITNENKLKTVSNNSQKKTKNFSQKRFENEILKLVI